MDILDGTAAGEDLEAVMNLISRGLAAVLLAFVDDECSGFSHESM